MVDIRQMSDPDGTVWHPETDVDAVVGLAAKILAGLKVTSVNGKTGEVVMTASDVGAATPQDIETAIAAITAGLYSKVEIDDKLAAKQDKIYTSPNGSKWTFSVSDDGQPVFIPYTEGSGS